MSSINTKTATVNACWYALRHDDFNASLNATYTDHSMIGSKKSAKAAQISRFFVAAEH